MSAKEGDGHAAAERVLHREVERLEVADFVAFHQTLDGELESLRYPLLGQLALQEVPVLLFAEASLIGPSDPLVISTPLV